MKSKEFESLFLRDILKEFHDIEVGLYSYGCFDPRRIGRHTKIGRYCSFARTSYRFNGNHGKFFLTLHPYVYNVELGLVTKETIDRKPCVIEDDVWVGHNAIILPNVECIGRGAIVGAGAVVTKNVPRYAIVAGNPSKVIGYRFDEITIKKIESSRWWEMDKNELAEMIINDPNSIFHPERKDSLVGFCD